MKNIKNVKIKNWEICCDEILTAIVNISIDLNSSEDSLKLVGTAREITYCPYCGKKLPKRLDHVELNED